MLDNDHQPPARLMAQMRLAAADLRLPQDMADRLAQRADMSVVRLRQLAPALSMMRTLSVRQGFEADDQAAVLGYSRVRLLTNNPEKAASLQRHQIDVSGLEPLIIPPDPFNARYLDTKATKFGRALPANGAPRQSL